MKKVNLNEPLLGFDGKAIATDNPTYKSVCQSSLWASEQSESGEDKYTAYKLSRKIDTDKEVELSAEDIVLLKKKVAKIFGALVVGLVWDKLESNSIQKESSKK